MAKIYHFDKVLRTFVETDGALRKSSKRHQGFLVMDNSYFFFTKKEDLWTI